MPAFSKQNILAVLDTLKRTDFEISANVVFRHSQENPHLLKYFHSSRGKEKKIQLKNLSFSLPKLRQKDLKTMIFFMAFFFLHVFASIALSMYHIKNIC